LWLFKFYTEISLDCWWWQRYQRNYAGAAEY